MARESINKKLERVRPGDDTPTESLSLVFASFQIDYTPQGMEGDASGNASASWDLAKVTTA